ncbi:unnamed protein product [Sphenostylis stenocarpa]|uniref:EXPERA domain-containing protein n=1 Tax=Sphenostylis stenocarpa TaxID=92480 RepID=A0AA86T549_9FABA|nr:unnamed protein product [Sphenostylis stenocarpa]
MAQTMLLVSCVPASYSVYQKRNSLLQLQNRELRPKFSCLFFNPLLSASHAFSSSPRTFTTLALFKTKTKAPPNNKLVKSKPKLKVEDGIFGPGGFGCTKQNELFVGRVTMLGVAASLSGEEAIHETEPLLLFFIIFSVLGAIGVLSNCGEFLHDPATQLDKPLIPPGCQKKSKVDKLLMWWWTFSGLTNMIIEGYFVFSPELFKDKTGFFLAEIWKEYSKADSRYAGRDAGVVTIEAVTAVLEGPASILAVYSIAAGKSYSYILQFAISLGQLYGIAVYFITAFLEGDDFSASSFYYYAYYIGANASWIILPSIVVIRCWRKICAAFKVMDDSMFKRDGHFNRTYSYQSCSSQRDVRYSCGTCGYELNLSSSNRNTSSIGSKYGKSIKRGIISFFHIDLSRFTQVDEIQCVPHFDKHSWGLFRRRTNLLCRKCGNHIGNAYNGYTTSFPLVSNRAESSPSSKVVNHTKYDIRIRALQPSSSEGSGTPVFA